MGLCPDCRTEGETITYIGSSKADVVSSEGEADDAESEQNDETEGDQVAVCDLCEEEYRLEEDEG